MSKINARLDEPLSSFIRHRKEYVPSTGFIHPKRLLPRPNPASFRAETSVCRSRGLDEQYLWDICTKHYDLHQKAPAIGHCVGPSKIIYEEGLDIDPDGKPYPQHANIVGWPDGENSKHHQMIKAEAMAGEFKFIARR